MKKLIAIALVLSILNAIHGQNYGSNNPFNYNPNYNPNQVPFQHSSCQIPKMLIGEWFARIDGNNVITKIDDYEIIETITDQGRTTNRGQCSEIATHNYDNFTLLFQQNNCYFCSRIIVRTLNVLERLESGCITRSSVVGNTDLKNICKEFTKEDKEYVTLFCKLPCIL